MTKTRINFLTALALLVFVSLACGRFGKNTGSATENPTPNANTKSTPKTTIKNDDDSTSGEEKQKPTAGKGNVQGIVLFNEQPVEGIEVKICETFSTILGIKCSGKTQTVKTDKDGVFVLANLEPITYGGLTAKVFKSNYYIYPQEGIMTARRFEVEADKTIFAPDIHLFKDDVKITNPKAGSRADAKNLELKWNAYPDASYYKVSLYPDAGGTSPVSGDRVDDPTYTVTDELTSGKYRIKVEAYNKNDRKLAESGDDIKFNVTGTAEPTPK
jgi:hypothetical protein